MKKRHPPDDPSDADAFARAMEDAQVVPLQHQAQGRVRATAVVNLRPIVGPPRHATEPDGDLTPDQSAFVAHGVDRRELRKLRRGDYLPADDVDLHGLTANAAVAAVRQFIDAARRRRLRCVCIVHGRGLRSPGGRAVLKVTVRALLRSHPAVLAFADAPRTDGGAGAVYVLLRTSA